MQSTFVLIVADNSATTDEFVTTGPEQLCYETGFIVYLALTTYLGEYIKRQIACGGRCGLLRTHERWSDAH